MKLLDQLLDATTRCLARYEAHTAGGPILAAVSGGGDSMVLALVLARLGQRGKLTAPLSLAHVDHGLSPASATAAATVRRLAKTLGLPFCERRLDLAAAAAAAGTVGHASEEALRDARYQALVEMAREQGARLIVMAHHADDNLETVLFRMMRGTGPRGLAGIPEYRRLTDDLICVRPFLGTRKATLLKILQACGLEACHDESNLDLRYARNRLRCEIIPALRQKLGNKLDVSLFALARQAKATTSILEAQALRLLQAKARFPAPWRCELRLFELRREERPFLEEALAQIHQRLHPSGQRAAWPFVQRAIELWAKPDGSRLQGRQSLLAERCRWGLLILDPERCGSPPEEAVELELADGGQLFGSTEWSIRARPLAAAHLSPLPGGCGPGRALLAQDAAPWPWRLRTRRRGDRFWPLGQNRALELRRFLLGRHLPRFDRDRLPLLVDAKDRILWVPGVEICHQLRIQGDTGPCVELHLQFPGGQKQDPGSY